MSGTKKIPFFGIDRQYANLREELLEATDNVYKSGQVLDGPNTGLFEKTIAKMCERKYAVSVNSGTQGLILSMRAISEVWANTTNVLIPAQSFVATLNSVLMSYHTPYMVDVDKRTGMMDISKIPLPIEDIGILMYVNLFGDVMDQEKLISYLGAWTDNKVPVIEDAAQSFGAYYEGVPSGKLGDISVLSFDPTKNLNNYGSGGMVLTDNPILADILINLRDNGKHEDHGMEGTNSKMSEADCAQMLVKLKYFNQWQERRTKIAEYYNERLEKYFDLIPKNPKVEHAWSKYVVHHPYRMLISDALEAKGIETKIHYARPLSWNIVYSDRYQRNDEDLSNAEEFSKTCLSLPIYPELTDGEVEAIIETIVQYSELGNTR